MISGITGTYSDAQTGSMPGISNWEEQARRGTQKIFTRQQMTYSKTGIKRDAPQQEPSKEKGYSNPLPGKLRPAAGACTGKEKQEHGGRELIAEDFQAGGNMRLHGIDRDVEKVGDFLVAFAVEKAKAHDFAATPGKGVDTFDNISYQFLVVVGTRVFVQLAALHFGCFVAFANPEMVNVIEGIVAGQVHEVRIHGTGEVDFVAMRPHGKEGIVHKVFGGFFVIDERGGINAKRFEVLPEAVFKRFADIPVVQ